MKFSIKIENTNDPFYKACRQHGQAMGIAVPYLLSSKDSPFKIVHTESSMYLEDTFGKKYKTHYGDGKQYNVAPSYMRGHGRQVNPVMMKKEIVGWDFHIFTSAKANTLECEVVSSKEVERSVFEDGRFMLES